MNTHDRAALYHAYRRRVHQRAWWCEYAIAAVAGIGLAVLFVALWVAT